MINNLILRKGISILLILTLLLTGFFIVPNPSHALTVEKTVTKYHLDIGVQQIWGVFTGNYDGKGNEIIEWDENMGIGSQMNVNTSITFDKYKSISNVNIYEYSASKFKWDDPNYTSNVTSKDYYDDNYADFKSNSINVTNYSSSGRTASYSYSASMSSAGEYDLAYKLEHKLINEVFSLMAGPYSTNPEADVKKNFPSLYTKLNAGRNGVDPKVRAYMFFTPVIIQYDVKEMVELPDPDPESIDAELEAPSAVKAGEGFNVFDQTIVGAQTVVKMAELYRTIDGERELIDTWLGSGSKGKNTGGTTYQKIDVPTTAKYDLVVTTEKGLTDTDTKTVVIEDGRSISGQVDLEVDPKITHEGHPVDAYDFSTYQITEDKETRDVSAKYAYEEGFASNRYYAPDGKIKKDGYDAIVTFPVKGTYPITLEVRLKGNSDKMTDKENVQVLKTPYIYDTLSGFQKQNRKQVLTFKIATYPGKPITDWDLSIKDLKSNETASFNKDNLSFVGDTIKTRDVEFEVLNEYWSQITVEFLTKYPRYSLTGEEQKSFSYKLKVEDSKGDTDDVYKGFAVVPDIPPIPLIDMQTVYTRNLGTNFASVKTECQSKSDGDSLLRTWSIAKHSPIDNLAPGQSNIAGQIPDSSFINAKAFPNYKEIGFGTDQKISFDEEGVGLISTKLHLKDVWTEPTLPEFIVPSDYLEAETIAKTSVINIAPVVSIEPLDILRANIMIFVEKDKLTAERNKENEMQVKFIENNIDANLTINEIEENEEFEQIEGYTALSDSENMQYMKNNQDSTLIRAYDINGERVWKYNIEQVDGKVITQSYIEKFYADQKERYGVLISRYYKNLGNETSSEWKWVYELTVLNAKTGVPIKTYSNIVDAVPGSMQPYINNEGNILYMVIESSSNYKFSGVWKIDLQTGSVYQIEKPDIYLPRMVEGKIGYIKKLTTVDYAINYIDLKTDEITTKALPTLQVEKYPFIRDSYEFKPRFWDSYDTVFLGSWQASGKYFYVGEKSVTLNAKTGEQGIMNTNYNKPGVPNIRGDSLTYILDKYGEMVCYSGGGTYDYDGVYGPPYLNGSPTFLNPNNFKAVTWDEYNEISGKIKSGEYTKASRDQPIKNVGSRVFNSVRKYSILNEDNTYLMFKNTEELSDELTDEFIDLNGIRVIEDSEQVEESVKADLAAKEDLALRIKGDSSNIAEIFKDIKIDSGKTYTYSYDMTVNSGTPSDLISIGNNQILDVGGRPYYKEVVYKEDLTRGKVPENKYVKYTEGTFNAKTDSDRYNSFISGYGGGDGYHDRKAGSSGPSLEFYLEKDGYVDLQFGNDAGGLFISFDGRMTRFNETPENFRMLKQFTAGKHTLSILDSNYWNDVGIKIQTIEVGYLNENKQEQSSSALHKNADGSYAVEGTFSTPQDVLYNYTGRDYIPMNSVTFEQSDFGTVYVGSGSSNNKDHVIISDRLNMFSISGISDKRDSPAYINAFGYGFNCGGRSVSFDFNTKNTTDKWMLCSFEWNGDKKGNFPIINTYGAASSIAGEHQSLGTSTSNAYHQEHHHVEEVRKVWMIIPPMGSGNARIGSNGYGWNLYNLKYGYVDEETVKTIKAPNLKSDEVVPNNGFFEWHLQPATEYGSLEYIDQSSLNVVDFFSLPDKIIVDKYRNMTTDNTEKLRFTTENSKGIDTYISNLSIKEVNNKNGYNGLLQNRNFNYLRSLENNGWLQKTIGSGYVGIETAKKPVSEDDSLIYKKGQLVKYGINYSDYENDPSKAEQGGSGWIYAHTPFNDGEHEAAAIIYDEDGNIIKICGEEVGEGTSIGAVTIEQAVEIARANGSKTLTDSIDKFYIDGKYTVYHFEYDDTSRGSVIGGYPIYDKSSNMADLTFYVQGTASAPWITGISTSPDKVKENAYFSINIGIDDIEKDILSLTTEVYKDRKPVFTHRKKNILPLDTDGNQTTDPAVAVKYPVINTGALPEPAEDGVYEVVCTVRDQTGAGLGSYKFTVEGIKADAEVDATKSLKSGYGITATVKTKTKNTTASKVIATLPDGKTINMVVTGGSGDNLTWGFPANTGVYAEKYNKKYKTISRQVFVPVKYPDGKDYIIIYRVYNPKDKLLKEISSKTYVDGNMYDDDFTVKSE